jgi:hypothetical protein
VVTSFAYNEMKPATILFTAKVYVYLCSSEG